MGCSTVSNVMKEKKFDETVESFHYAMRWSDFKSAITFRQDIAPSDISSHLDLLKPIKITSFSVIETIPTDNRKRILQVSEIQYYHSNYMKEKTVVARMLWAYDPEKENWYIVEGWPKFQ
jgi:hypothetical protein